MSIYVYQCHKDTSVYKIERSMKDKVDAVHMNMKPKQNITNKNETKQSRFCMRNQNKALHKPKQNKKKLNGS